MRAVEFRRDRQGEAVFKISLARRSSAFSLHRRFSFADSSLAVPGRFLASISSCFTQTRNYLGEAIPSMPATALIVAVRLGIAALRLQHHPHVPLPQPRPVLRNTWYESNPFNEFTLQTRRGTSPATIRQIAKISARGSS